jgi:hypothetical protein
MLWVCKIWDNHGNKDDNVVLLGCDAITATWRHNQKEQRCYEFVFTT